MTRRRTIIFPSALFFLCGFTSVLNMILSPFLQDVFSINYKTASYLFISFYLGYFFFSPIAGRLFKNNCVAGIRWSMLWNGAITAIISLSWLFPYYPFLLVAIFLLGGGIVTAQVTNNPYVLFSVDPEKGRSRLSFAQAFTSIGTILAPPFGSFLILHQIKGGLEVLQLPYLLLSTLWLSFFFLTFLFPLPKEKIPQETEKNSISNPLGEPIVAMSLLCLTVSIGIEVTVSRYLIPLLTEPSIIDLPIDTAGEFSLIYWIGFLIGRLLGAKILEWLHPKSFLFLVTTGGALLGVLTSFLDGVPAVLAVLAIGLCASMTFPLIYSLVMENCLSCKTTVSAYMCMGNIGGALLPFLQGALADQIGVHLSFLLPALCYAFIALLTKKMPVEVRVG